MRIYEQALATRADLAGAVSRVAKFVLNLGFTKDSREGGDYGLGGEAYAAP